MRTELNKIICGDALKVLKSWPDDFVDLVITSPPYFALRDYQVKGQLGLEPSFEKYLRKLLEIIIEVKRVLKPSGQFWLNLGDIYGGSPAGNKSITKANKGFDGVFARKAKMVEGAKSFIQATDSKRMYKEAQGRGKASGNKCLSMMPERIAITMCDQQGWILRNRICWCKQILDFKEKRTKGSVMPSSVKDRFNESWEYLYFFTKNKKYFSNLDAVRLPPQTQSWGKQTRIKEGTTAERFLKTDYFNYCVRDANKKKAVGNPQGINRTNMTWNDDHPLKNPDRWFQKTGKNLPTVWLIGSEPHNFKNELGVDVDHFATFPQALCEIPIKFGCPEKGIVLDPFCGSGTALLIAKQLGRNYLGIELNPAYIKLAEARLSQQVLPL